MHAQVLQRGLPRPTAPPAAGARPAPDQARLGAREAAEALLANELAALLAHEAAKYPVKEKKKGRKRDREDGPPPADWEAFDAAELAAAKVWALVPRLHISHAPLRPRTAVLCVHHLSIRTRIAL